MKDAQDERSNAFQKQTARIGFPAMSLTAKQWRNSFRLHDGAWPDRLRLQQRTQRRAYVAGWEHERDFLAQDHRRLSHLSLPLHAQSNSSHALDWRRRYRQQFLGRRPAALSRRSGLCRCKARRLEPDEERRARIRQGRSEDNCDMPRRGQHIGRRELHEKECCCGRSDHRTDPDRENSHTERNCRRCSVACSNASAFMLGTRSCSMADIWLVSDTIRPQG